MKAHNKVIGTSLHGWPRHYAAKADEGVCRRPSLHISGTVSYHGDRRQAAVFLERGNNRRFPAVPTGRGTRVKAAVCARAAVSCEDHKAHRSRRFMRDDAQQQHMVELKGQHV